MLDIELEPEQAHIDKEQIGFFVSQGGRLQDVLVIAQTSAPQMAVRVPLSAPGEPQDKIVVIAKQVGQGEVKVGSVSLPQELFLSCGESEYKQWITLFDHLDDDDYDGDFGDNDEETPRVLFKFRVEQESSLTAPIQVAKTPTPKAQPQPATKKSPNRESISNR